ncbi:GNAT family N-acetyltransferase [Velocimicrobium porci]|uniref:N-acetyltransferase n=1 Tax=Velocimicrobium porci TaxID=2606634 RepID=A0A6L5XZ24_9FIRM|nr:N-acetyltransferase [Velocimicrobium porci]MSS63458.1 N-acetyltransferase [Velocimicrobium porci]
MRTIIRQETREDRDNVYKVIKKAFETVEHSDHDEQNLVNRLRESDSFIPELSLVAEKDKKIIGYILFTKVSVNKETLLALAPLAVHPDMQNKGIGKRLIKEGHKRAVSMGYKGCIVLGHHEYYKKSGYQPASLFHIVAPFDVPDKNYMAIELTEHGLENIAGTVVYAKEFYE